MLKWDPTVGADSFFNCEVAHECSSAIESSRLLRVFFRLYGEIFNWRETSDAVLRSPIFFKLMPLLFLNNKTRSINGKWSQPYNMYHSFMSRFNCSLCAYRGVCWYDSTEYSDFSQTFRTLQGVIMENDIEEIVQVLCDILLENDKKMTAPLRK